MSQYKDKAEVWYLDNLQLEKWFIKYQKNIEISLTKYRTGETIVLRLYGKSVPLKKCRMVVKPDLIAKYATFRIYKKNWFKYLEKNS